MAKPQIDSTFNNMITSSRQNFSTQLLDTSIEDLRDKKKTMALTMDSIMILMREVECEEKAAEQAKEEGVLSCSDIILKLYDLQQAQQHVKKTNDMLAREVCAQKAVLATKMDVLQLHVASLLDKGDRSLELLDEMHRGLKNRMTSALMKKELENKKRQENEACVLAELAYEEVQMEKVEKESKRLKQEAAEISKLLELLIDRGRVVEMLHGEISDKCQDVKLLKKELDQVVLPGGEMPSSQISSILASSSSYLRSLIYDNEDCEGDMKIPRAVADISESPKKVRIKGKPHGNQMFAKCVKKVKIKGKLHRSCVLAKSIKKEKIKGKLHVNQMCFKSIKKVRMKGKLFGNRKFARSIKKVKYKGKLHENQMCAKSIKKVKIKGRLYGNQMCAKRINKVRIKGKLLKNRQFAKNIKKVKIKGEVHGNQMFAKNIKTRKMKVKLRGNRILAKSIKKKLNINGLLEVSKRREAATTGDMSDELQLP